MNILPKLATTHEFDESNPNSVESQKIITPQLDKQPHPTQQIISETEMRQFYGKLIQNITPLLNNTDNVLFSPLSIASMINMLVQACGDDNQKSVLMQLVHS